MSVTLEQKQLFARVKGLRGKSKAYVIREWSPENQEAYRQLQIEKRQRRFARRTAKQVKTLAELNQLAAASCRLVSGASNEMLLIGIGIGLFIGVTIGFIVVAILTASARSINDE